MQTHLNTGLSARMAIGNHILQFPYEILGALFMVPATLKIEYAI